MFGSLLFNVLAFASGIASVVSLLLTLERHPHRRWVIRGLLVLVVVLSVFSSYSYFTYAALRAAEQLLISRKQAARHDAGLLLAYHPPDSNSSTSAPGQGIAWAGLALLEQYRDVYPKLFDLAQGTVRKDLDASQKTGDSLEARHRIETANAAMLQILRGLGGGSAPH